MEIVIDIPKAVYERVKARPSNSLENIILDEYVKNGKTLPEHHGRLIDADALYDSARLCHTEEDGTACVEWREINDAPTIIEADKCTYKKTGCGSCKRQLDCPTEAEGSDSE